MTENSMFSRTTISGAVAWFFCFVLALGSFTGCGQQEDAAGTGDLADRKIRVVTTTGMIADAVEHVGGDRVQVTALMGPGVDPHLYKASAGDVSRMLEADAIFYNGLHLEGKMGEVFEQMQKRQVRTAALAEGIDEGSLLSPPEFDGAHDPHVWFDVGLWTEVVSAIGTVLQEIDAAHATIYVQNAEQYVAQLDELDRYVREQAQRIPEQQRVLITAHDAFNYFGRAYGFEVRGLQGISTAAEAGTADMQGLSRFIVERRLPAMFVESSVPRRSIEAVQAAVSSKGFEVSIGGELFSDAMGSPGTPEATYEGMVRHNIDTIVDALATEGS